MPTPRRWVGDAFRSRPLVTALLVVLSGLAVLLSALGPLLVRADAQAGLRSAVTAAGEEATALVVSTDVTGSTTTEPADSVDRVLAAARSGADGSVWTPGRVWADSTSKLAWRTGGDAGDASGGDERVSSVRLPVRSCAEYAVVSGRCPTTLGEVALSSADATAAGVRDGQELTLRAPTTSLADGPPPVVVRLVGTYTPDPSDPTLPRPGDAAGQAAGVTGDPLLLALPQLAAAQLPASVHGRLDLVDGLTLPQEEQARASVQAAQQAVLLESRDVSVDTGLTPVLDAFDARSRTAALLVLVTEAQVLLLAVFAVSMVLRRVARVRTPEWGVGRLRGLPRPRWWASIYAEPGAALLLGVPLGLLAAGLVARAVVGASLPPGTPVELGRPVVLTTVTAVVVALLVALAVASAPVLRRPLVELVQQRSEAQQLGVVGAVVQSGVLLLAAAAAYALVGGGVVQTTGSQLGLLAPGLVALALALLAVRLSVLLVRRVTSRSPRGLVGLVVGRQAARAPSTLDPALVVTVGVAIAVFATQVFAVSDRNQTLRAEGAVGASTVLTVAGTSPDTLLAAVQAADPTGRQAMAVQELDATSDTGVARVVAVDSHRFAAVTGWPARWWAAGAEAAGLAPATAEPVVVEGSELVVGLADVRVDAQPVGSAPPADPDLLVSLDTGDAWRTVDLGPVRGGSGTRRAAVDCERGCRVAAIGLRSDAGASYEASVVVTALHGATTGAEPDRAQIDPTRWRSRVGDQTSASPRAKATPTAGPSGLRIDASDADGGNVASVLPADALDPLPAVVSARTDAAPVPGSSGVVLGRGLDGRPQQLQVVGQAQVLPRSLTDGVLVDLGLASRLSDPSAGRRTSEVWLAPGADDGVRQALVAAGLTVTGEQTRAGVEADLHQQPIARAAATSAWLGALALLLTLVAFATARTVDVVRRRPDWRSLRDAGVSHRATARLVAVEVALPAGLGVLLGLLSGLLTSALALPRLPLVDLDQPGPPLDLGAAWAPVVLVAAVAVVCVLLTAVVASRAETRRDGEDGS